jgi:hypothetical protein
MTDQGGPLLRQPNPLLTREYLLKTLITILNYAMPACAEVEYRLVGTGAALLWEVELPVGDIDILMKERDGVEAFCQALKPFKCLEPASWLEDARQYYANYEVGGVEVGLSTVEIETDSDVFETIGRGPWEHFSYIPCGLHSVPTVSLELRVATELYRNRPDRYTPILQYLSEHGCDVSLIRRGMEAADVSQALREDVLNQLEGNSI